jgi:hypothetical protein
MADVERSRASERRLCRMQRPRRGRFPHYESPSHVGRSQRSRAIFISRPYFLAFVTLMHRVKPKVCSSSRSYCRCEGAPVRKAAPSDKQTLDGIEQLSERKTNDP